jgi:hypothetical protein
VAVLFRAFRLGIGACRLAAALLLGLDRCYVLVKLLSPAYLLEVFFESY